MVLIAPDAWNSADSFFSARDPGSIIHRHVTDQNFLREDMRESLIRALPRAVKLITAEVSAAFQTFAAFERTVWFPVADI